MSPAEPPPPDGHDPGDLFGPLERSGIVRGIVVVVVAFVLGALLLDSATRPGIGTAQAASATTAVPSAATTTPSTSPTTTAPAAQPASSVKVLVANGTRTNGAAASVSSFLTGKGYATLAPVDALTTVGASQVYAIGASSTTDAHGVATALGLSASSLEPVSMPVPVPSTAGATVVVVVGPDLVSHS